MTTSSSAVAVAVMAGGRGLRLWPRSTASVPKQFHGFFGGPVLLEQSMALAALIAPPDRTFVVTAAEFTERCRAIAGDRVKIVAEPVGRDTAACAGLAALHAEAAHPGAVLVLLPADHWVGDLTAFEDTMATATEFARQSDRLVTVGVVPDRPETGYGYITVADGTGDCRRGLRFREKPDASEATRLIAGGSVFWNAGIFVAKAAVFLELIRLHLPALSAALGRIGSALGTADEAAVLAAEYTQLEPVSFDRGVAEQLDDFLAVPAGFRWDDLGSWPAFARLLSADPAGNVTVGRVLAHAATGCLVDVPDLRTVLVGVANLIVVQEGDCLLIASPEHAQTVKRVAAQMGENP